MGQPESAAQRTVACSSRPASRLSALRARRRWRGRCAPAGARGSRVTASRYALGAKGGGAARPGAYMCSPRNCARCLLGGSGDVEDVVSCPLLQGFARSPDSPKLGVASLFSKIKKIKINQKS